MRIRLRGIDSGKLTEKCSVTALIPRKGGYVRGRYAFMYCYLDIKIVVLEAGFSFGVNFGPECMNCIVPKLLLQPLIENSIKYGFRKKMELNIKISGHVEGQCSAHQRPG